MTNTFGSCSLLTEPTTINLISVTDYTNVYVNTFLRLNRLKSYPILMKLYLLLFYFCQNSTVIQELSIMVSHHYKYGVYFMYVYDFYTIYVCSDVIIQINLKN